MFERSKIDTVVDQVAVPVEVTTDAGETVKGRLMLPAGRSTADLLNGPAAFLEFEPYGGERAFMAKAGLRSVKPLNVPRPVNLAGRARDVDGFDPHGILGIPAGAPLETAKAAWHALAKTYHPDRYANIDLPQEVKDYLSAMARRINAAYAALEVAPEAPKRPASVRATPIYTSGPRP